MKNTIQLGISIPETKNVLGEPLKTSEVNGFTILRYTSNSQRLADFYYFSEGKLVQASESIYAGKQELQSVVNRYGVPEESIFKYKDRDQLFTVIHLWPKEGKAYVSYGITADSLIEREFTYESQPLQQYLSTLGKTFSNNDRVGLTIIPNQNFVFNVSETPTPIMTIQPTDTSKLTIEETSQNENMNSSIMSLAPQVVLLIFFLLLIVMIGKKLLNARKTEK